MLRLDQCWHNMLYWLRTFCWTGLIKKFIYQSKCHSFLHALFPSNIKAPVPRNYFCYCDHLLVPAAASVKQCKQVSTVVASIFKLFLLKVKRCAIGRIPRKTTLYNSTTWYVWNRSYKIFPSRHMTSHIGVNLTSFADDVKNSENIVTWLTLRHLTCLN